MCTEIFIGTQHPIPVITRGKNDPGFYTFERDDIEQDHLIHEVLNKKFYYGVGSFMGCSCGLALLDYLKDDYYDKRRQDVQDFLSFLEEHKTADMALFATLWENFPEYYDTYVLDIEDKSPSVFELPEDVIITLK